MYPAKADAAPSDVEAGGYRCLQAELGKLTSEIAQRNATILKNDDYIYGNRLERALDIPIGHDHTNVNWLRRTVEIHKIQFMGRPFSVVSTYNSQDISSTDDPDQKKQLELLNKKSKLHAELRQKAIADIIRDNGGHALFASGAESASAVGDWVIKLYYDEDADKVVLSPVEAVENCWAAWNGDDFRSYDLFAYAYQISPQEAADKYGIDKPQTSPLGAPMVSLSSAAGNDNNTTGSTALSQNLGASGGQYSNQPMVTVLEATGKIPGYGSEGGSLKKVSPGQENELNVLFIGGQLQRLIDEPKRLPRYYVLPNKQARRRAWGIGDISDAAIQINATYVETLSDWRTVQAKVNFPKFRGFNFGPDTQMPKMASRKVQFLPLGDGQDVQPLAQGDANGLEFEKMLGELKEQFVRETGISRVLFDDPSITLNSNQALLTSMKPTSDIAENKKQLWGPLLERLFNDALTLAGHYDPTIAEITDPSDGWYLRLQWPSIMQKEDPIYQQMLLNRWNAKTISLQSYLEAQGESNEEVDRLRDEMSDVLTAAIHGNQLPTMFALNFMPPPTSAPPKVSVNLKGELPPDQEANLAYLHGFNGGDGQPFPTVAGPQGYDGARANSNFNNQGSLDGQYPNQTPIQHSPAGKVVGNPATNTPGAGPVSQPGSGATAVSPQGALDQVSQNAGQ
jgi:hypothetical protein